MKKLSFPILVCAALGLVTLFLPNGDGPSMFTVFREFDSFRLFLMIAAFALPIAAAILALRATTPKSWYGMAALGGFAIATVKAQVWLIVSNFGDTFLPMKLQAAAIIGGAIVSILAVAKEDRDPTS